MALNFFPRRMESLAIQLGTTLLNLQNPETNLNMLCIVQTIKEKTQSKPEQRT